MKTAAQWYADYCEVRAALTVVPPIGSWEKAATLATMQGIVIEAQRATGLSWTAIEQEATA